MPPLSRALPGWSGLLLALLSVAGVEAAVRSAYVAPGDLPARVAHAAATLDPIGTDVLLFGTCLGEETLDHTTLADSLGRGARVHSLASAGTAPVDWYLALRNVIDPASVDLVVVAFAPGDLMLPGVTWQTQTLDMADWTSIREVAWWNCTQSGGVDAECASELYLRKASLLYRNRPYLANRFWSGLGLRAEAATGSPHGAAGPAPGQAARVPASPLYWVQRFVDVVRESGRDPVFLELPRNPDHGTDADRRMRADMRADMLAALGRMRVEVHSPEAPRGDYTDDVHVTRAGRDRLTAGVAEWLRARVGSGAP
jgi:hypothetical protein